MSYRLDAAMVTGNTEIDSQHAGLLYFFSILESGLERMDVPRDFLSDLLLYIIEQMKAHFKSEETLMKELGYPDFAGHSEKHKEMLKDLGRFAVEIRTDEQASAEAVMGLLKTYMEGHLKFHDKQLIDFLKERSS